MNNVFGSVFGVTAADYPSINYVRNGITFASGALTGVDVLPVVGNVRELVGFGANGTEFYGTLFVPSSTSPSWTNEMDDLFEDMINDTEYRTSVTYKGQTIYGVKMALSLGFTMQLSGYQRKADTSVDIRRSDAISTGLYSDCKSRQPVTTRPQVNVLLNNEAFMVLDLKDDNATDPTVKLILSALQ